MRGLIAGTAAAFLLALAGASPAAALEVWAVGDGGDDQPNDDQVGAYIGSRGPERFLYLGDVYPAAGDTEGSYQVFQNYYGPAFGGLLSFTSPTPGNHEWPNHGAGYDPYFGMRAPLTGGGHWFSFNVGGWHFVSLNSEEPIGEGSDQLNWLRSDIASQPGDCTIAYMHKPRFTDGFFAGKYETLLAPAWGALSGRAVALISAHDHNYQRFHPVDGVTQLVVGTGGHGFHAVTTPTARLAAYSDNAYGALHLTVNPGRADYEFVTTAGVQKDSGAFNCTNPAPPGTAPPPAPGPQPGPQPPGPVPPPPPASGHDDDPLVLIGRPRSGAVTKGRVRVFSGTATNLKAPVRIVVTRRAKGRCLALGPKGFRYSCKKPPSWRAKGISQWRLTLPRKLALSKGSYRVLASADGVSDVSDFRVR
jgi:hypothetical protein